MNAAQFRLPPATADKSRAVTCCHDQRGWPFLDVV